MCSLSPNKQRSEFSYFCRPYTPRLKLCCFVFLFFTSENTLISQRTSCTVKRGLNLLSSFPKPAQFKQRRVKQQLSLFLCARSLNTFPYGEQTVCASSANPASNWCCEAVQRRRSALSHFRDFTVSFDSLLLDLHISLFPRRSGQHTIDMTSFTLKRAYAEVF